MKWLNGGPRWFFLFAFVGASHCQLFFDEASGWRAEHYEHSLEIMKYRHRKRYKPLERQMLTSDASNDIRLDIRNMTCDYFEQPLNHFALPRRSELTYRQRYCIYNGFVPSENMNNATVLFYSGNESPLEQYINNTGLMWEMAPRLQAQIVFVEHRYEGKSLPDPNMPNCMAYSSSIQALADYANFIEKRLFGGDYESSMENDGILQRRRPVIAFGGSYGGMLAAWMRMKYPNIIAGAVAASAPIWGFPRNFPTKIDSAWQVIQHGIRQSYPPTLPERSDNHCADNLLASYPLIHLLSGIALGRELLSQSFRLCNTMTEDQGDLLLDWVQSPWFDMAEGSFPYPSSYIPFSLTHNENARLPAWPLQSACWKNSSLYQDFGITYRGNLSEVRYEIIFDDDEEKLISVDWDNATATADTLVRLVLSDTVAELLNSVRDAVSVWFNVTLDVSCYDLTVAPNLQSPRPLERSSRWTAKSLSSSVAIFPRLRDPAEVERDLLVRDNILEDGNSTEVCRRKMNEGSWPSLCCNEEMHLIITDASGMGRDAIWPPSHPRGTSTFAEIISEDYTTNATYPFCQDPDGMFGYPQDAPDPWATWYDEYYGGTRIDAHSNIIFSNGLLDPWSAAGVYAKDMDPSVRPLKEFASKKAEADVAGLFFQNITEDGTIVAIVMQYGGHHTDLMYSSVTDPPSITAARIAEERFVRKWIYDWWDRS